MQSHGARKLPSTLIYIRTFCPKSCRTELKVEHEGLLVVVPQMYFFFFFWGDLFKVLYRIHFWESRCSDHLRWIHEAALTAMSQRPGGTSKKSSSTKTHFQASGFLRCFLSLFFFGTCFPIKIVGCRLEACSSKSRTLGRSRVQLWVTWVQFPPMLPPEMLDEATDISKLGNWCQHFFLGLGCVTRAGLVGTAIDVGAFGDALWGQVTCRAKGSRALTVQKPRFENLEGNAFVVWDFYHPLVERILLPSPPKKRVQKHKVVWDSFWWPLETAGFWFAQVMEHQEQWRPSEALTCELQVTSWTFCLFGHPIIL